MPPCKVRVRVPKAYVNERLILKSKTLQQKEAKNDLSDLKEKKLKGDTSE